MSTYYCSTNQLYDEFRQVHTVNYTAAELLPIIERAGSIIDAFLSNRYPVPFAQFDATPPTPGIIKTICIDLTLMDLFDRMPGPAPDWIIRRTERAYELLKMIADTTIDVPGIAENAEQDILRSTTSQYVPVFGAKPSLGERVDINRTRAERDAREAENT